MIERLIKKTKDNRKEGGVYLKNKILKKSVAFLLLVSMNMNIFAANLVLDPNSQHNTKLDTSANGTPIINISTPNNRGVSINEFLEYNVGHEGQVIIWDEAILLD
mgnify:FL=1